MQTKPTLPSSIQIQQAALRQAYLSGDVFHCAAHHLNLASQLQAAGYAPALWLAHQAAGTVLLFQADSEFLPEALGRLALVFVDLAPHRPPIARDFASLVDLVEKTEGVEFAALVRRLGQDGGADGDEALHAVLGLAQSMAEV